MNFGNSIFTNFHLGDERTFEQFKHDLKVGNKPKIERPTNEQLEATIKDSYKIMQSFEIEKEGG